MIRRSAVLSFACVLLVAAAAWLPRDVEAQGGGSPRNGSAPLPSGDQIIAKYEQALGGAAALGKVTTRTTRTRRIVDIGTPSDHYLLRYAKRGTGGVPLSIMNHRSLDGQFLQWTNGCDGRTGWQRGGNDQIRDADTVSGGICEHELAFYGYFALDAARMRKNFQRLEVKGVHKIVPTAAGPFGDLAGGKGSDLVAAGARDAYLVLGIPSGKDDPVWLFFDVQTGFLLRRADAGDGDKLIPAGDSPRITDFIQYREVGDGTRMPFQFVTIGPNAARTRGIHISVTDHAPVDDKVFIKPRVGSREDKGLS